MNSRICHNFLHTVSGTVYKFINLMYLSNFSPFPTFAGKHNPAKQSNEKSEKFIDRYDSFFLLLKKLFVWKKPSQTCIKMYKKSHYAVDSIHTVCGQLNA